MCVICLVDDSDKRPTEAEIRAMWDTNSDGGGFAWRDTENKEVIFKKALTEAEMISLMLTKPTPFVAHFRLQSIGAKSSQLTHPFVISPEVLPIIEGGGKFDLLFHNGTWTEWRDTLYRMFARARIKVPPGEWSDTRAMAILAHHFGENILELIDHRVAVFGPEGEPRLYGSPWPERNGYVVSNELWIKSVQKFEHQIRRRLQETASQSTSQSTSQSASSSAGNASTPRGLAVDTTYTVPPVSLADNRVKEAHHQYLERVRGGSSPHNDPFPVLPDHNRWTVDTPQEQIEAEWEEINWRYQMNLNKRNPRHVSKNRWKHAQNRKDRLIYKIRMRDMKEEDQKDSARQTELSTQLVLTPRQTSTLASSSEDFLNEAARVLRDPRIEVATMRTQITH
jgi:hypothetical protein